MVLRRVRVLGQNLTMLDKIFDKLDDQDLETCALVQRSWFTYIHYGMGLNIKLGSTTTTDTGRDGSKTSYGFRRLACPRLSQVIRLDTEPEGKKRLKKSSLSYFKTFGVRSAWFTGRLNHSQNEDLTFRSQHLLRKIICDGLIKVATLHNLIKPLEHLREFVVGQTTLMQLVLRQAPDQWSFPALNTFIISGKALTTNSVPTIFKKLVTRRPHWKRMIRNVLYLLKNIQSPNVRHVVLQDFKVGSTKEENLVIDELVQFIQRHQNKLKKVSIGIAQISETHLNPRHNIEPINFVELAAQLHGLRLEAFLVHNGRAGESTRRSQQLLNFMLQTQTQNKEKQNSLKQFVWIHNLNELVLVDPALNLVPNNCQSLTSIEMTICQQIKHISCEMFSNCILLNKLTLVGGNQTWRNDDGHLLPLADIATVTDLNMLPFSTVRTLRFCNLKVNDTAALVNSNVKLDFLELHNIGVQNGGGVQALTLAAIMNMKQIQFISLKMAMIKNSNVASSSEIQGALDVSSCLEDSICALLLKLVNGEYELYMEGYALGKMEARYDSADPCFQYHGNFGFKLPYGSTTYGIPANKYPYSIEYQNVLISRRELYVIDQMPSHPSNWADTMGEDEAEAVGYSDLDDTSEGEDDDDSGVGEGSDSEESEEGNSDSDVQDMEVEDAEEQQQHDESDVDSGGESDEDDGSDTDQMDDESEADDEDENGDDTDEENQEDSDEEEDE